MLDATIAKRLGSFRLGVRLVCPDRGIVALFGRSGSGKTSVVNALAGLLRPDDGRILLNGETLFDSARGVDLPPERRRIGYVFQEGRLFPHLSVRGNLEYGWRRRRFDRNTILPDQVIELLGLGPLLARRPRDLSGGEKQRVALGRALLAQPRLLLMDEPLASLDLPRKEEILPFIERLRDELSLPIVYVSHAMEEIVRLADQMVLLDQGSVAAVGTVEDVTSRLDLRPLTGRYEAGAAIETTVGAHEPAYGLTCLNFPGGTLWIAALDLPPGEPLRVRVRARDVALSRTPPDDTSFQNAIRGIIREIADDGGPFLDLRLETEAGTPIWSRITRKAFERLALAEGAGVFALIDPVAIDRHSVGRVRSVTGKVPPTSAG